MELIGTLFQTIINLISSLFGILVGAVDFIVLLFVKLPIIITNNLFAELPFVFRYGLMGCFGVVMLIATLKLVALLKIF